MLRFFILLISSLIFCSCCPDCGPEPAFDKNEESELPNSKDSLRFMSSNGDISYHKITKHIGKRTIPCGCTCPEKSGTFQQMILTNLSLPYTVNISKDHDKVFQKFYSIEGSPFNQFDTSLTNYSVGGINYPKVDFKTLDTNYNRKIFKIYSSKEIGVIKYELSDGTVWEMK